MWTEAYSLVTLWLKYTKSLLGTANTPSSRWVAAVGPARSHDVGRAQISVCEADFPASPGAGDHGSPSVLASARPSVTEAAVFVGPFYCASSGSGGGEDASGGNDHRDDGVKMHVGDAVALLGQK